MKPVNEMILRGFVFLLYVGYLFALSTALIMQQFFHATLLACLSLHFVGLFGGLFVWSCLGQEWANPYPREKLGTARDTVILIDCVQFFAFLYVFVSYLMNYNNDYLLIACGSIAYIGIFVCFWKFFIIFNFKEKVKSKKTHVPRNAI